MTLERALEVLDIKPINTIIVNKRIIVNYKMQNTDTLNLLEKLGFIHLKAYCYLNTSKELKAAAAVKELEDSRMDSVKWLSLYAY